MPPSAAPECERVGWIFEIIATSAPASKASIAARIPAQPAPTTSTSCFAITWNDASGKGKRADARRNRALRGPSRAAADASSTRPTLSEGDASRLRRRRRRVLRLARGSRHRARRRSTSACSPTTSPRSAARAAAEARPDDDHAASSPRCAPSSGTRSARSASPTDGSRRAARGACPTLRRPPRSSGMLAALEGEGPIALRNRALVELVYSAGLRSAEAVGLDLGDVDFEQELVHVRHGKGGKERVVPLGEEAQHWLARYLRDARPELARGANDAFFLSGARPPARHEHPAPHRPAPAPAPARLRDAPARRRRRPAHDPGAARPQLALDDADLQPRRPAPPAPRVRPRASRAQKNGAMRVSAKVDYALRAMTELAAAPPGLMTAEQLASAQKHPAEVPREHPRPAPERRARREPARRRRRLPARAAGGGDLGRRRHPRARGADRHRARRAAGRARVRRRRDRPARHLARAALADARRPRADDARGHRRAER